MTERHETDARHILLLGSTGSIGRQALDVLAMIPGAHLVGLAAGRGVDLVLEQAARFSVRDVCLSCLLYTSPSPRD